MTRSTLAARLDALEPGKRLPVATTENAIIAELTRALRPFAAINDAVTFQGFVPGALIKAADVRRAKAALARSKAKEG